MNYGMRGGSRQSMRNSAGGRYSLWNKYHSTGRFQATVAAGPPATYTVKSGTELRLFGYAVGQDLATVGFPANTSATNADTNLTKPSETVGGEAVDIYGISILLASDSEPQIAKLLWPVMSVILSLNGDAQSYKLGTPEFIPGAGGLCGQGDSYVTYPDQTSYLAKASAMTNGFAMAQNFYPFQEPVQWLPSGNADSALILKLRIERDAVYTALGGAAGDRAAVAAGAGTVGTAAWTHPTGTALGTYVTVKAHLWSKQSGPRSGNS